MGCAAAAQPTAHAVAGPQQPAAVVAPTAGDPQLALLLALESQSLKGVCGSKCHPVDLFAGAPRDYQTWHDTVQKMIDRGADASDEQLQDIMDYLHRTLTTVNVNTAAPEELSFALGLQAASVQAIVARRAQRKFVGLEDFKSVLGGDSGILTQLAFRLVFQ